MVAMRPSLLAALALVAMGAAVARADTQYADPWDPATVAAAEAAVARLGAKQALEVRPSVLAIPGLALGVRSATRGIVATVQELQQAKRDLGAQETDLEVKVDLPADVLFDFDKADIRPDAAAALGKLATIIGAYPRGSVDLGGHTDSKGADDYNVGLSQRRADAVRSWLVDHGIDGSRIRTHGCGETRPVADNTTDVGRQRNRRVEALIHKNGG